MNRLPTLLAAALVVPIAATAAPAKSAFDRADPAAPAPWLADGSASPSALALDDTFTGGGFLAGAAGMVYYDGNDAVGSEDIGLRTFLSRDEGYTYVVGIHRHFNSSETNDAFIMRIVEDGSYDTTFGDQGKLRVSVPFPIADVAMDPSGLFYFAGAYTVSGFSDTDFGVYCVDEDGVPCAGFGSNGLAFDPIDVNGHHDDTPTQIVYDLLGSVFVIGYSNTAATGTNIDVSVAKFNSNTGDIETGFGNHSGAAVVGLDRTANGRDVSTAAMLTYPASPSGLYRLYLAGTAQITSDTNDYDGFVMALDPASGAYAAGFDGGIHYVFFDLGTTDKRDALTAIAESHDGRVLLAGFAENDAGDRKMTLAAFGSNGSQDTGFCGGAGHCINDLGVTLLGATLPLSHYEVPSAIAERRGNHDLVLALDVHDDFLAGSDGHPFQEAVEIGPSGLGMRTWTALDYTAHSPAARNSYTHSMTIDDGNRVLVTGSRVWDDTSHDSDVTVARLIDIDTIFVNGFEAGQ